MPELPEVQTTVDGIQHVAHGLKIIDVWTDLYSSSHIFQGTIKDKKYFVDVFRPTIIGKKIISVRRRAKNILLNLDDGNTILIHMKMTGHIMYGKYTYDKKFNSWTPEKGQLSLTDPFNRFIHLVFTLNNGYHLVLSDMRKFAKVTLLDEKVKKELEDLGPEPLEKSFSVDIFITNITRFPNMYIKTALMDQRLVVGIGNIYSDEILHESKILPYRKVSDLSVDELYDIYNTIQPILRAGIDMGGDSMSDYRNIYGERGRFQGEHKVYRRTNLACTRKKCTGLIERMVLNNRSAHFCKVCQK